MEKVSDVEDWKWPSRRWWYIKIKVKGFQQQWTQAKTMAKPLAEQVARRVAMDTALDMAEAIENSWAVTSSSMEPPSAGVVNDSNYLPSSVPVANFFNIMPVPREPLALDDHRWDLLGQGSLLPCATWCARPMANTVSWLISNPGSGSRHRCLFGLAHQLPQRRSRQALGCHCPIGRPPGWRAVTLSQCYFQPTGAQHAVCAPYGAAGCFDYIWQQGARVLGPAHWAPPWSDIAPASCAWALLGWLGLAFHCSTRCWCLPGWVLDWRLGPSLQLAPCSRPGRGAPTLQWGQRPGPH